MSISYTGATVFVDIDNKTQLINFKHIIDKISSKTKAIVVVHLYGQCAEMKQINKIAKKHNSFRRHSQAHGAIHNINAGTMSDIGTFSFYPGRNLGATGETK